MMTFQRRTQNSWVASLVLIAAISGFVEGLVAGEWRVPVGGNAFRVEPSPGGNNLRRNGVLTWGDSKDVYAVFVHIDQPAELSLAIEAKASQGESTLEMRVGERSFSTKISGTEPTVHAVGKVRVDQAGYVRIEFRGKSRTGDSYGEIREVIVQSDDSDLKVDYVRNNDGNMFYWGRRGPSVHLTYSLPRDRNIQYGYSEITVPVGKDPIGSYYMANGFGEGYFGIQVNGPDERRVLFSVWSPFQTDNPKDIPEDQRIAALGKGPGVRIGEFGNEGSGGQSFLVYPWKAGTTYRFLTEVKPDGEGRTVYTSWFGDKSQNEWRLIASFRRPKTDTHLKGFHSFLESFDPSYGHIGREAEYGNVWVCDMDGEWHECLKVRFSVDATGGGRHRLDFGGGAEGTHFFMKNCGFFSSTAKAGDMFTRTSTADQKPQIDFSTLPRE